MRAAHKIQFGRDPDINDLKYDDPHARPTIHPVSTDTHIVRVASQYGKFTISPQIMVRAGVAIDETFAAANYSKSHFKFILPATSKWQMIKKLRLLGITKSVLFPDDDPSSTK